MQTQASVPLASGANPVLRDDTLPLVHRATFGYSQAEHVRAASMGFNAWRDEQLDPMSIDDSQMDAVLSSFPTLGMSAADLVANYPLSSGGDVLVARNLRSARILRAQLSKRQLFERMIEFWTDHFNVDGQEGPLRYLKTVDDREVIRAHALGRFRDLLGASAKSGAMLVYLDNFANEAGAPNENYARELMELHTLGVNGGFTEADVLEVARCFTGWTIRPQGDAAAGTFVFRQQTHDNGGKTVLGTSIPSGGGRQDGETVLDILAAHPSTAEFIARKLCAYFLTYDPPQSTLDRVASRFSNTGGDISATMRAVLSRRSFDEVPLQTAYKLKRPLHLAIAALRSTGAQVTATIGMQEQLRLMGHLPFAWPAPNGFPDSIGAWGSNLLSRWSFATQLMDGQVAGTSVPNASVAGLLGGIAPAQVSGTLNERLTGGRLTSEDALELQEFVNSRPVWNITAARESIALALSLPSSQWV